MVCMTDYRAVVLNDSTRRKFACTGITGGWKSFTAAVFATGAAYAYNAIGQELEPKLFTDTAYTAVRSLRKKLSGGSVTGPENRELGEIRDHMLEWAEKSRCLENRYGRREPDWFNVQSGMMAKELYFGEPPEHVSCADMCLSTLSRTAKDSNVGLVVFLSESPKGKEPESGKYRNLGNLYDDLKDFLTGSYYRNNLSELETVVKKQNRFDEEVSRMVKDSRYSSGDRETCMKDMKRKAENILVSQLCIMSLTAVIIHFGSQTVGSVTDLVISEQVKEYFQVCSGNEKVHMVIDGDSSAVSCAYLFGRSFDPVYGHHQELKNGVVMYTHKGTKIYTVKYTSSLRTTIEGVGDKVCLMIDTVVVSDSLVTETVDNDMLKRDVTACIGHDVNVLRAAVKDGSHSRYVDLYLNVHTDVMGGCRYRFDEPEDFPELLSDKPAYSETKEKNM